MRAPTLDSVSPKLHRIANLARQITGAPLRTLAHHIDRDFLREAFRRTRKGGAVGVDHQTAQQYAEDLEANLQSLLDRVRTGQYRAPAVRRVHIPKGSRGHETRPIGIPTFEDKILQRAVHMVLEAVYEPMFLACSYGFRPGRSAHHALGDLWKGLMAMPEGWVLEIDLRSFFDTLDHGQLRAVLRQRVQDGNLLRLIGKWLRAGVLEAGQLSYPEAGTPQGGVISPLLSNIFLHTVLDEWFERVVRPRLRGRAMLIRYADDAVMAFACEEDARRVWRVLPQRLARFGLTLHPEKTRLVPFARPGRDSVRPGSFSFLGFTHYWARSRRGMWVVKRKTARDRFSRALRAVTLWCRRHRHVPLRLQQAALTRKLQGHFAYYGLIGNSQALVRFRWEVGRTWVKWLRRRSWASRLSWERFNTLLMQYPLPRAHVASSLYRPATFTCLDEPDA